MNPKVDKYLGKIEKWQEEMERLRAIILDCGLTEELKWGTPCYSFQNTNIVIIGVLKDCCVISFFKGSLLDDSSGILGKPGENTQSARLIRFRSVKEIANLEPALKAYIYEAIEVGKAGLKVSLVNKKKLVLPEELRNKLEHSPSLKTAFNALTPGRQRAYILYFSAPKQSKTRQSRIEKYVTQILRGKGLNDDYKNK
jgi:uncharacterized protein YdeI (YjbR/CyaY-like superfamily)